MAFCTNCGKELKGGAKFCAACGSPAVDNHVHEKPFADTTEASSPNPEQRKQEFVGSVRKCPACGEEIPSFTAICPACGHEINSAKVSSVFQEFIDGINACDECIANNPKPPKTGWASWGKGKRIWWIILNIFTSCIPLVIYLLMPLLKYNVTPKLTAHEKRKASLIENFPFPNDRESILEALLFARTKVAFLAVEKVDRKNAYWTRLWSTKAEQLYQKAEMMFQGDPIVREAYKEIVAQRERVSKTVKFRAIAGVVILIVAFVFIGLKNGAIDTTDYNETFKWQTNDLFSYLPEPETNYGKITHESEKQVQIELYKITSVQFDDYIRVCREAGFTVDVTKTDSVFYASNSDGLDLSLFYYGDKKVLKISLDSYSVGGKTSDNGKVEALTEEAEKATVPVPTVGFAEGTYRDITVENFTFSLPNYWEDEEKKNDYKQYYAETGGKVAMFAIACPVDDEDEVMLDFLVEDNKNMIKVIESLYNGCKVSGHESFSSDFGVEGIVYDFSFTLREWFSTYDMKGKLFCFPSIEDNRWFYVMIGISDNTDRDFDKYIEDYTTILAAIRKKK